MKRFHVHVAVDSLVPSIAFYSGLFGQAPTVTKDDYAKWSLDDPRVNFAISARGRAVGVDHLGIQVESERELEEVTGRLREAGAPLVVEAKAVCCYAESDKSWTKDPAGISWETFHTTGHSTVYGGATGEVPGSLPLAKPAVAAPVADSGACCAPAKTSIAAPVATSGACCAPTPDAEAKPGTCGPA